MKQTELKITINEGENGIPETMSVQCKSINTSTIIMVIVRLIEILQEECKKQADCSLSDLMGSLLNHAMISIKEAMSDDN